MKDGSAMNITKSKLSMMPFLPIIRLIKSNTRRSILILIGFVVVAITAITLGVVLSRSDSSVAEDIPDINDIDNGKGEVDPHNDETITTEDSTLSEQAIGLIVGGVILGVILIVGFIVWKFKGSFSSCAGRTESGGDVTPGEVTDKPTINIVSGGAKQSHVGGTDTPTPIPGSKSDGVNIQVTGKSTTTPGSAPGILELDDTEKYITKKLGPNWRFLNPTDFANNTPKGIEMIRESILRNISLMNILSLSVPANTSQTNIACHAQMNFSDHVSDEFDYGCFIQGNTVIQLYRGIFNIVNEKRLSFQRVPFLLVGSDKKTLLCEDFPTTAYSAVSAKWLMNKDPDGSNLQTIYKSVNEITASILKEIPEIKRLLQILDRSYQFNCQPLW